MILRKERPRCRKAVERLLTEGYVLEQLADSKIHRIAPGHFISDGIRAQARKMLKEKKP